jgi:hypothetical protein
LFYSWRAAAELSENFRGIGDWWFVAGARCCGIGRGPVEFTWIGRSPSRVGLPEQYRLAQTAFAR